MKWSGAWVKALIIVAYFVFATVWLPDKALHLHTVEDAPGFVRDVVATFVWADGLVLGLIGLRWAQRRRLI